MLIQIWREGHERRRSASQLFEAPLVMSEIRIINLPPSSLGERATEDRPRPWNSLWLQKPNERGAERFRGGWRRARPNSSFKKSLSCFSSKLWRWSEPMCWEWNPRKALLNVTRLKCFRIEFYFSARSSRSKTPWRRVQVPPPILRRFARTPVRKTDSYN